ncbi:hypothetical protein KP79_PYT18411 [Mizuhopecten yessoensis]|uniref:SOCS box domain-containing protein n=1 Tax=Mizuhopecten yessoensis TaxID=6573 RepID=A0A210PG90_MIZYE|nr:hypothetical protein KP79_PYT18411 [Mizuhopecten yessoensis]
MGASANSTRRQRHLPDSGPGMTTSACVPFLTSPPDGLASHTGDYSCCVSYNLQPHTTDNRHIHAQVQRFGRVSSLCVNDITHDKIVKIILYEDRELDMLPARLLQNTGLQLCNVVGIRKDLVVIQVFCQDVIKFFVCSLNDASCKIVFDRKYCSQNKLQLYECQISPDENYLLILQNQLFAIMYAPGSEVEHVSIVHINWEKCECKEKSCDSLDEQMQLASHQSSVVFDPRTNNDLVVFTSSSSDRGVISLYKTYKDNFLFKIIQFRTDCPALPGKFQNLQFMNDGSALVLSVIGTSAHPHSIASICRLQVVTAYWFNPDCYDKLGSFWYISPTLFIQYMPMISTSGRYACCGGKIYNLEDMHPYFLGTKSLKRVCRDVIVDSVLAEDIGKLPLPKPLLRYLSECVADMNQNM